LVRGGVTPSETLQNMDVLDEPTWTYSRRVSEGVTPPRTLPPTWSLDRTRSCILEKLTYIKCNEHSNIDDSACLSHAVGERMGRKLVGDCTVFHLLKVIEA